MGYLLIFLGLFLIGIIFWFGTCWALCSTGKEYQKEKKKKHKQL